MKTAHICNPNAELSLRKLIDATLQQVNGNIAAMVTAFQENSRQHQQFLRDIEAARNKSCH